MFGLRLKSWMEAHLGRPRHKSTHNQNQKQQQQQNPQQRKEFSIGATSSTASSSTGSALTTSTTTTVKINNSSSPRPLQPSTVDSSQKNLLPTTVHCPVPNAPNGLAGGLSESSQDASTNLLLQHHQRILTSQPGKASLQPSSTSSSIILGSFSNNLSLSSPDTGYSTDGYSPKSVYPALSFESSGKSTPKSSYTISSLVSSERLNNSISCTTSTSSKLGGGPSKNSSISNGLELEEEEEVSLDIPGQLLPDHPHRLLPITACDQQPPGGILVKEVSSGGRGGSGEENKLLNNPVNNFNGASSNFGKERAGTHVGSNLNGNNKVMEGITSRGGGGEDSSKESALLSQHPDFFSHPPHQHRRTESMGGGDPSRVHFPPHPSSGQFPPTTNPGTDTDNILDIGASRVRTSLLLTSHIPADCYPGLKNAFSLCSPRRQRTRIKTNPWVTFMEPQFPVTKNGGEPPNIEGSGGIKNEASALRPPSGTSIPPPPMKEQVVTPPLQGSNNPTRVNILHHEPDPKEGSATDSNDGSATNILLRISSSASASDSGKGTLEPGTNRNSAESSCLLSDSTSTDSVRNSSIISPSTESDRGLRNDKSASLTSSEAQCVATLCAVGTEGGHGGDQDLEEVKTPSSSASSSASTTPGVSRADEVMMRSMHSDIIKGVIVGMTKPFIEPCPQAGKVDKETDILSDWANTSEEGEEEDLGEEEEEDNDECVTPTPSSPDVTFNHSSCSSADGRLFNLGHHQIKNNNPRNFPERFPFQPHNMNLPTTCYNAPIPPQRNSFNNGDFEFPTRDTATSFEVMAGNFQRQFSTPPDLDDLPLVGPSSRLVLNGNNQQSSNNNNPKLKSGSQTIARGAIGFLRKMFKKGSSSATAYKNFTGKGRFSRSSSKDSKEGIDNNTIIPVGLLSPETVVVNNYPLSNTKPLSPAINSSFLTPTPNAFRRRNRDSSSDSTTEGGGGKSSKRSHKGIKTDIIRLPQTTSGGGMSNNSGSQPPSSSSSLQSSSGGGGGGGHQTSRTRPGSQQNNYNSSHNNYLEEENHRDHSTAGSSSIHSLMSMSSASEPGSQLVTPILDHHQHRHHPHQSYQHTPNLESQHHAYVNVPPEFVNNPRQSPYLSNFSSRPPTTPRDMRETPGKVRREEAPLTPKVCPYDSPRGRMSTNSPSFNNSYSPIHRLVVTGGNQLLRGAAPIGPPPPPPNTSTFHSSSPIPLPRTPNMGNAPPSNHPPVFHPLRTPGASPLIGGNMSRASPYHPPPHPLVSCSPSPILRNPRYQYITSSNQNSPMLNVPKRLNNVCPRGGGGGGMMIQSGGKNNGQSPLFLSPSLSSRNSEGGGGGCGGGSYNKPEEMRNNFISHHQRAGGGHMQNTNHNNNHPPPPHHLSGYNRGEKGGGADVFHHPKGNHYYSAPIPGGGGGDQSGAGPYHLNGLQRVRMSRGGRGGGGGSGGERIYETVDDSEEEEEDLTRSDDGDGEGGDFEFRILPPPGCNPMRDYGEKRGRGGGGRIFAESDSNNLMMGASSGTSPLPSRMNNNNNTDECQGRPWKSASSSSSKTPSSAQLQQQQGIKSTRRSKTFCDPPPPRGLEGGKHPPPRQQPPVPPRSFPMMLGTYLSETETRLLEADNDTDRKYKRLINEAEALLKEISLEKAHQFQQQQWEEEQEHQQNHHQEMRNLNNTPWMSRYAKEAQRQEDCPQSDPLRRKAYDCWALRRLQQELAGCCASPPVLHRSRLHITSPVSPSSQNRNLSLAQYQPELFPFNNLHPRRGSSLTNTNPPPPI